MRAFSSPRRSENARSSSLWRRWRALSTAIWRSRCARSASRRFASTRSSSARFSSPPRARELRARAITLLDLRPQLPRPGTGAAAVLEHPVSLGLCIQQLGGRLGELLEPLPEVLPVPGDHLKLRIEQRQNARVFRPEGPLAGGTRTLRAELHDLVALLLHLFVQFEQLGALRLGILPVPHPRGPLLLRSALDRLQALVQSARRRIRPGEGLRHVAELREATLEHSYGTGQLGELRLFRPPRRRLTLHPLERRDLLLQPGHRRELGAEQAQLLPGGDRIRELLVEPLEFLARRHHRLLRHAPLAVERQRALAAGHPVVPARLLAAQRVLRGAARGVHALRRRPGLRQPVFGGLARRGEGRAVREAGLETPHLRRHGVADFAHPLLRLAQALVAEHARQERRPLGLPERRHHRQLLLAGEVGVEELVVSHSQRALELVGDRLEGIRDHLAVLVERRGGEPARHAVLVGAEPELEVHLDPRPALRAQPADRVLVPAHRLRAVQRPGDRLEDRRLPGAVRPDDPRDPRTELELGIGVLPEVHEAEAQQLHQAPPSPSPSWPTCARYSTPSRTNSARSKSASSGRCSRNSWTVSGSVCRRPGAPAAATRWTSGRRRSSWK